MLDSVLKGHQSDDQSAPQLEEIIQERPEESHWNVWRKFLHPLCHDKGNEKGNQFIHSLDYWKSTLQTSHRLWPHYSFLSTNKLYKGYRKHEHNHREYQFDQYGGSDDKLFDFTAETTHIDLCMMPNDTVPVDVASTPLGWRVCYHSPAKPDPKEELPALSFVQYVKSQPKHVSQYYEHINCIIPAKEIYKTMKTTSKIIMATDGGAIKHKGRHRTPLLLRATGWS